MFNLNVSRSNSSSTQNCVYDYTNNAWVRINPNDFELFERVGHTVCFPNSALEVVIGASRFCPGASQDASAVRLNGDDEKFDPYDLHHQKIDADVLKLYRFCLLISNTKYKHIEKYRTGGYRSNAGFAFLSERLVRWGGYHKQMEIRLPKISESVYYEGRAMSMAAHKFAAKV